MNLEQFLNQNASKLHCVRCESKENMVSVNHATSVNSWKRIRRGWSVTTHTKTTPVPLCGKCGNGYQSFQNDYSQYISRRKKLKIIAAISIIIGIVLTTGSFFPGLLESIGSLPSDFNPILYGPPALIIGITLIGIMLILKKKLFAQEDAPYKYMAFREGFNGNLWIKSQKMPDWVEYLRWLETTVNK